MSDEQSVEPSGTSRRRFMQAAAAAGVVGAVWAEPIIRGTAAGAVDGVSVNGRCTGAEISWTGGMDTWGDGNASVALIVGAGAGAMALYTWNTNNMFCDDPPALTAPVQVTADGDAEALVGVGATVSITSGASCKFENIVTTSGTVTPVDAVTFTLMGVNLMGATDVTFNIVC